MFTDIQIVIDLRNAKIFIAVNLFARLFGILRRLEADMNDELAAVKDRYETTADPLRRQIEALTVGLHTWCEANRDTLTQGGKTEDAVRTEGLHGQDFQESVVEAVLETKRRSAGPHRIRWLC